MTLHGLETFVVFWQFKIKQIKSHSCPCREAEPPFLPSIVLLLPCLSFHWEVKIQPPKLKKKGFGKNSYLWASPNLSAPLLQVSRPAKYKRFPWPVSEKPEKGAICGPPATSSKAASLGLNFVVGGGSGWLFFLYWGESFCFLLFCLSQPPLGWVSAILILFIAKLYSSLDRKWRIPHSLLKGSQKLN